MVWIALVVMICAVTLQHLGLPDEVARMGMKIARCPKCLSFWSVLVVLLLAGCDIVLAFGLSLLASYASLWYAPLLIGIQRYNERLWQRMLKKEK